MQGDVFHYALERVASWLEVTPVGVEVNMCHRLLDYHTQPHAFLSVGLSDAALPSNRGPAGSRPGQRNTKDLRLFTRVTLDLDTSIRIVL